MYKAPLEHYKVLLERFANQHEEYDLETMQQVLFAVAQFCQDALWPTNKLGDKEGLKYN